MYNLVRSNERELTLEKLWKEKHLHEQRAESIRHTKNWVRVSVHVLLLLLLLCELFISSQKIENGK